MDKQALIEAVQKGYAFKGEKAHLGAAMLNGEIISDAPLYLPLKTMNRHGLIAGATGTGKTKTLQVLAEILSEASVPVLLMDIKGDLSGLAAAGASNKIIDERYPKMNMEYKPQAFPVEFLSLTGTDGVRLRATVTEFGPILLSKILGLNDTQGGLVALIFKYCDDHSMPLVDLKDFTKMLQYVSNEGKEEIEQEYGKISTTSTGTILRKVIELQQQGADAFFGEPSFDVNDLMRIDPNGYGMINVLRLVDIQDKPKLFSTFMLQLLTELYNNLPEEGDMDKPKLVMFIDEAHLVFQEASSELLKKIESVIKLIRSKGVGIFFCTQNPMDVPAPVLSQLGLKIQHALRAFTANDRKAIKQTAENYPETSFYDVDQMLTQIGIGEAFITLLNEKGIPTPLVHAAMCSPRSRMDILTQEELDRINRASTLIPKYRNTLDAESAYEILERKMKNTPKEVKTKTSSARSTRKEKSTIEKVTNNSVFRSFLRTVVNTIARSVMSSLGVGTKRKSR